MKKKRSSSTKSTAATRWLGSTMAATSMWATASLQFALQQMANSPSWTYRAYGLLRTDGDDHCQQKQSLALTSLEWLEKIMAEMPTHKLWEDKEFKEKIEKMEASVDREKAIHDYNLLKARIMATSSSSWRM